MSETEKYIRENLFSKLESFGVKSSDDYVLNMFNEPCYNSVFTYKGKERRISNIMLFRINGQSRGYRDIKPANEKKPTKKDVKSNFKDEVDAIIIPNSLWVDMQLHNILTFFKIK